MKQNLIFSALFLLPLISSAEESLVPCNGPDCDICHIVQLGQNIITWLVMIIAFIIALVFVIGGLKMVMAGGDTSKVSTARKMMANSVIGLIILLGAWLIINTIMVYFVRDNFFIGKWNQIECNGTQDVKYTPPRSGTAVEGGIPAHIPFNTEVSKTSMNSVSMTSVWGGELYDSNVSFYRKDVPVRSSAGVSMPIYIPKNLNQNMVLSVTQLDQNGQYMADTQMELSGSRAMGVNVISEGGLNPANIILTPADAGRVIYYNFAGGSRLQSFPTTVLLRIEFGPVSR